MADTRKLLTVEQVAERVQVHPETVRRWLRDGRLKGVRLGGTKLGYRISEDELERFVFGSAGQDADQPGGQAGTPVARQDETAWKRTARSGAASGD